MGNCCEDGDPCPRYGICSDQLKGLHEQILLCPNEDSCGNGNTYIPREIRPNSNGMEDRYENLNVGMFKGDVCNFEIMRPDNADTNDVIFLRIEYLKGFNATVFRGLKES